MRIWLCQIGETPAFRSDERKMRNSFLAAELASRGHQVVWWSSQFNHNKKDWRDQAEMESYPCENVQIKYLRGCGYKKNISIKRFLDHRLIAKKFNKLSKLELKPDIIIASIPTYDLAYEASKFAKDHNIPFVVDIRDQWPEIFVKYSPRWMKPFTRAALFYDFKIFKKTLLQAQAVISMMSTILEWALSFEQRSRTSLDQVFYLGCLPNSNFSLQKKISERNRKKLKVTFVGTFGSQNNPMVIVEAARILRNEPIEFIFGGTGVFFNEAVSMAKDLENCQFLGWLNNTQLNNVLIQSDVAICPTPQFVDVFPNKVFAYLANGLPVITSTTGDLEKIIQEFKIGSTYKADSAIDLANKIKSYLHDESKLLKQFENVDKFYRDQCNAEKIYSNYADFIIEIVTKKST